MSTPRRARSPSQTPATRNIMSVYPPRYVGAPLGGYRSTTFSTALRCWAHVLSEAALEVAQCFAQEEWEYVFHSIRGRTIEPEFSRPGAMLAELAVQRHRNTGAGDELPGRSPDRAVDAVAEKLRELNYAQAWAVVVACGWREEHDPADRPAGWWTVAFRARQDAQAAASAAADA